MISTLHLKHAAHHWQKMYRSPSIEHSVNFLVVAVTGLFSLTFSSQGARSGETDFPGLREVCNIIPAYFLIIHEPNWNWLSPLLHRSLCVSLAKQNYRVF